MGQKSGYDLCLALKNDAKTSDIPVVILCGNSAPFDADRAAQVGADGNLAKPWDTQVMLEKCTEFVERAKSGTVRPGQAAPAATPMASAMATGMPAAAAAAAKPAAPAAAPSKAMPPRSATIMGMPTIKLPAGPPGASAPAPVAPVMVAPAPAPAPAQPPPAAVMPAAPAPAAPSVPTYAAPTAPIAASAAPAAAPVAVSPPSAANLGLAFAGSARTPLVSGMPSKKSQIVERTLARMQERLAEAAGLPPGSPELAALVRLSSEVVERVVWEVVPDLAEQIIRENLNDLAARRAN